MAELLRTHPLEAWIDAFAALPPSVGIAVEPYVRMVNVRGADSPVAPNTWEDVAGGRAIWLGPDEWLLTSTTETPSELESRGGTDVSAQRITLRLTGERIRDVLAKGCAIDLHPRGFGRGKSAQSTLGQAAVVLLSLSDAGDEYLVLVRSSFAGYLADWLLDATLEFK
jgi:sarcosine oxidase subunit gamma